MSSAVRVAVLALTRYGALGASSRVRFLDWIKPLAAHGIDVDVRALLPDSYVRALYSHDRAPLGDVVRSFARRLAHLAAARHYDLLWVEKELYPWLPFAEAWLTPFLRRPVVVDIDDAVFHNYDLNARRAVRAALGRKLDGIFRRATLVLAGNSYLAERAQTAGAPWVEILPTVVETERYQPRHWPMEGASERPIRIGWIGSPATEHYLLPLADMLRHFAASGRAELVLIGARPELGDAIGATTISWSRDREVADLQSLDVGMMPLPDDPWARGKCGFKIIQYMACAVPAVASPVGANRDIVVDGETGLLVEEPAEWRAALERLAANPELRRSVGQAGRARVEQRYSREAVAPRLASLLRRAVSS